MTSDAQADRKQPKRDLPSCRGRILFLIDSLGMGGAERLMPTTLAELRRQGFAVRVCALQTRDGNPLAAALREVGVDVDLVPLSQLRDLPGVARLYAYLRRQPADLVHTQLEWSNILGPPMSRVLGLPSVATLHNTAELAGKAARRLRLMQFVLRHLSERIICVCEPLRKDEMTRFGMPPAKVVTLHNGIDLSAFDGTAQSRRRAIRRSFNLPEAAPVMVTVAVLRAQKGISTMIAAMPEILRRVPDAHYLVVGDGPLRAELTAAAAPLGGRIVFAGLRMDIPAVLQAADLFVLPSLFDPLPTVLMEAMAAGLPIVATAVDGVPEMVTPEMNGVLVPPNAPAALAEACVRLLTAPETARAMGTRGRIVAEERFSASAHAARLGALYDRAITRSRELRCASPS